MKKSFEEWKAWAKQKNKSIAFYKQKTLDLTQFMKIHPGGKKSLENYLQKDVSNLLFSVYPHKKQTTLNTLLKYTIGVNTSYDDKQSNQKENNNKLLINITKQKKRVCFRDTFNHGIKQNTQYLKSNQRKDDSLDKKNAEIRKTINQKSKSKKHQIIDKHQVSIKLISESQIADYEAIMRQKAYIMPQNSQAQQIDTNINYQDLEQSSEVSALPTLQIKIIKK